VPTRARRLRARVAPKGHVARRKFMAVSPR
jgi:hypothetical protein